MTVARGRLDEVSQVARGGERQIAICLGSNTRAIYNHFKYGWVRLGRVLRRPAAPGCFRYDAGVKGRRRVVRGSLPQAGCAATSLSPRSVRRRSK